MPKVKNSKIKTEVKPKDEEVEEIKPKDGPVEIPEDDDKAVDPDLLEEDDPLADEDPNSEESTGLDDEEIDPFGDKWEQ